jgi:hypothetical protein
MSEASNVVPFPVIPRIRDQRREASTRSGTNLPGTIRLQLKDIIDTAYDGLLKQQEDAALVMISEILMRGARRREDN